MDFYTCKVGTVLAPNKNIFIIPMRNKGDSMLDTVLDPVSISAGLQASRYVIVAGKDRFMSHLTHISKPFPGRFIDLYHRQIGASFVGVPPVFYNRLPKDGYSRNQEYIQNNHWSGTGLDNYILMQASDDPADWAADKVMHTKIRYLTKTHVDWSKRGSLA
jgi:hypothetical protein